MIIGFGFGSPLTALLMLFITGFISYSLIKAFSKPKKIRNDDINDPVNEREYKERRRKYYSEQRQRAYELMDKFDLTDEEIEKIIEEEITLQQGGQ